MARQHTAVAHSKLQLARLAQHCCTKRCRLERFEDIACHCYFAAWRIDAAVAPSTARTRRRAGRRHQSPRRRGCRLRRKDVTSSEAPPVPVLASPVATRPAPAAGPLRGDASRIFSEWQHRATEGVPLHAERADLRAGAQPRRRRRRRRPCCSWPGTRRSTRRSAMSPMCFVAASVPRAAA